MAIEITARTVKAVPLHTYKAKDEADALAYMATNSVPTFVHGFSVEGVGVVIVTRGRDGKPTGYRRLYHGEFVEGDSTLVFAT